MVSDFIHPKFVYPFHLRASIPITVWHQLTQLPVLLPFNTVTSYSVSWRHAGVGTSDRVEICARRFKIWISDDDLIFQYLLWKQRQIWIYMYHALATTICSNAVSYNIFLRGYLVFGSQLQVSPLCFCFVVCQESWSAAWYVYHTAWKPVKWTSGLCLVIKSLPAKFDVHIRRRSTW